MNKELKEQVIIEANNLKKHATKEELNKLDFNDLSPIHTQHCIYGQMTGYCHNDRARQLILSCTDRYYTDTLGRVAVSDLLGRHNIRNFSPIEVYIGHIGANNKTLIDYLRGDRDSLTTKDL